MDGGVLRVRWAKTTGEEDDIEGDGVHLAESWEPHVRDQLMRLQSWVFSMNSIGVEGACLAVAIVVTGTFLALARLLTTPSVVVLGAVMIVAMLGGLAAMRSLQKRRCAGVATQFAEVSDPRYRLRVVGRVDELERLRRGPSELLGGFEPGVYRIANAIEPVWRRRMKLVFLCGGTSAGLISAQALLAGNITWMYSLAIMGCAIGRFGRAFVWPTYLRVSPGKLEVIQYPFLGAGKPGVRSYDLRLCKVALAIHGPLIVFPPGSDEGELFPAATSAWLESEPLGFERTVIAAALTGVEAAPLPDDELIG